MNEYQAIIFDCGGVIFTCSFDNAFDYWAMVSGKDINEISNKFNFDEIFQEFERGEIDSTVFRKHVLSRLGLRINDENFDKGWNSIYLDLVPGIKQLLQELKQKYRLVALTNTNEIHARKWRNMYASILKYFEKVFSSHEIHARKPEQEAYKTVLNYLQLNPDKVIFLDDNTEYVQAASEMNIASIHVTSFKQMVEDLSKLGVEVKSTV
jgi:putative hydrolase of the HAD superfamily